MRESSSAGLFSWSYTTAGIEAASVFRVSYEHISDAAAAAAANDDGDGDRWRRSVDVSGKQQKYITQNGLWLKQAARLSHRDRATRYVSWKYCQLPHNCTKNHIKKAYNMRMTLKITQGHRNCHYMIGHMSLPSLVTVTDISFAKVISLH